MIINPANAIHYFRRPVSVCFPLIMNTTNKSNNFYFHKLNLMNRGDLCFASYGIVEGCSQTKIGEFYITQQAQKNFQKSRLVKEEGASTGVAYMLIY